MPETKKQSRFFQKVSKDVLTSPGGMVCLFLAAFLEVLDWVLDVFHFVYPFKWEAAVAIPKAILDFIFAIFSAPLLRVSVLSNLLPFLFERIPFLSTIVPTWIIRILL
jgi:hypothetical protein